jgi:hypothetical protein
MFLVSCVSVEELPPKVVEQKLSPFPPIEVLEYTSKPIIDIQDDNYIVSSEFLENSLGYKKWYDRVQAWKKLNKIK